MLAPNHVSAPATTHTSSMPPKLGTTRLTSDGWTKIDAPTIVPTTMAVACVSPIDRARVVTARECYLSGSPRVACWWIRCIVAIVSASAAVLSDR
jgi:hypothetical protein